MLENECRIDIQIANYIQTKWALVVWELPLYACARVHTHTHNVSILNLPIVFFLAWLILIWINIFKVFNSPAQSPPPIFHRVWCCSNGFSSDLFQDESKLLTQPWIRNKKQHMSISGNALFSLPLSRQLFFQMLFKRNCQEKQHMAVQRKATHGWSQQFFLFN